VSRTDTGNVTSLRALVREYVRGQTSRGATCDEVEAALSLTHQTTSARVHELMKLGAVVDSGVRRRTRSNRDAVVWVVPEDEDDLTNGPRHWFSNDLPYVIPYVYRGVTYLTPEHWYQANKTREHARHLEIVEAPTPMQARRLGRDAEKTRLRPDWSDDLAQRIMRVGVRHRFITGSTHGLVDGRMVGIATKRWRDRLLATGSDEIVETNTWHDIRWGRCVCLRHEGLGTNWLGEILMAIRAELDRAAGEDGHCGPARPKFEQHPLRNSDGTLK
jgi:ribA/ribD-fused uncharacterized protein